MSSSVEHPMIALPDRHGQLHPIAALSAGALSRTRARLARSRPRIFTTAVPSRWYASAAAPRPARARTSKR